MITIDSRWKQTTNPLYPWVATVNRIFAACQLPHLLGPTIALMSDYGGEHRTSRYDTISILAFDSEARGEWEYRRRQIRSKILKDSRRMSFKNLADCRRKQALLPFLSAANTINGVCATFVIRKEIKHLCSLPEHFNEFQKHVNLEGSWNSKSFDRVIRLVHFVSLLIAGLSHPKQNVYWISDEDCLFANTRCSQDVVNLATYFTSHYVKYPLGELGIGTTQIDEADLGLEDLTAVPDLVAGGLAEIATSIAATYGGRIPVGLALSLPAKLSPKAKVLADWLADDTQSLKRPTICFDLAETGELGVSRLTLA
jgi:hypothetical protein